MSEERLKIRRARVHPREIHQELAKQHFSGRPNQEARSAVNTNRVLVANADIESKATQDFTPLFDSLHLTRQETHDFRKEESLSGHTSGEEIPSQFGEQNALVRRVLIEQNDAVFSFANKITTARDAEEAKTTPRRPCARRRGLLERDVRHDDRRGEADRRVGRGGGRGRAQNAPGSTRRPLGDRRHRHAVPFTAGWQGRAGP